MFHLYSAATRLALPLAYRGVARKLRAHGVDEARIRERLGHATLQAPDAPLIWFHAASVGESLAVLTLIARLGERLPRHEFLITSGTATSAELIGKRMPPRSRHQFAPLDAPAPLARFLDHWRPVAAIFVESELWPLMLERTRASGARLALVNARLSPQSVRGWSKFPRTAAHVLDQFSLFLTQNATATEHLLSMGADRARVVTGINLKSTSAQLPVDHAALEGLRAALGARPAWIASSTHSGEEPTVLAAHKALLRRHPDLCCLLIPRHPDRGDEIARLIAEAGLSHARRSRGELPGPEHQVYLADTLGEMGTLYAAAPVVFLGGSLSDIGGHNPFEPADAGAAILTGPYVRNFAESFEPLLSLGAAQTVRDEGEIARAVGAFLDHPGRLEQAQEAARVFSTRRQAKLDDIVVALGDALALAP
jgi:3-deoxy-D-manno-octulosonic-acid transferase